MERNAVGCKMDDKGTKEYAVTVTIIVLMLFMGPYITEAAIIYMNDLAGIGVGIYWPWLMHLMGIAFLSVMVITYYYSRGKHADKRTPSRWEGYIIAATIIATVATYAIGVNYLMGTYYPIGKDIFTRFERIGINDIFVTKSTSAYALTINFTNTGTSSTSIDYVLLDDVPYKDSNWTGTIKPTVTGSLLPNSVIAVGASCAGTITFSDDCVYVPSGYRLTAGVTVKVTIHTTGGKDYETSVTLP